MSSIALHSSVVFILLGSFFKDTINCRIAEVSKVFKDLRRSRELSEFGSKVEEEEEEVVVVVVVVVVEVVVVP